MNNEIKLGLIFLLCILSMGCATTHVLKAPCDEHASWCGYKTKINHW